MQPQTLAVILMILFNIFRKRIELTNENWFEKLTLNSRFTLNGLKINDSEDLIHESYNVKTYGNTDGNTRKIYVCPSFKNHYKVKNGIIIGFGLSLSDLSKDEFLVKFGEPNSEEVLIGHVYGMSSCEIDGYDLVYNNFRLVMDPLKVKIESIQFGEKLLYWDE